MMARERDEKRNTDAMELERVLKRAEEAHTQVEALACLGYASSLIPRCTAKTLHESGAAASVRRIIDGTNAHSQVHTKAKQLARAMRQQIRSPAANAIVVPKSATVREAPRKQLEHALANLEASVQAGNEEGVDQHANSIASAAQKLNPSVLKDIEAGPRLKSLRSNAMSDAGKKAADTAIDALRSAVERTVDNETKIEHQRRRAAEREKLTALNLRQHYRTRQLNAQLKRKREEHDEAKKARWLQQIKAERKQRTKQQQRSTKWSMQQQHEEHHGDDAYGHEQDGKDHDPEDDMDEDGRAAIAELRRITGYDPSKYAGADTGEVAVASYADVQQEEKHSKRIADEEDRRELERLQQEDGLPATADDAAPTKQKKKQQQK